MFLIRFFDIILSLIAIIIFSPFYLIISIINIFDNSGPILFIQKRVTINQKLFNFIKFRSMKNSTTSDTGDNENYLSMDLKDLKNIRDNYVTTKSGDSRVTNIGKVLRKTSLDEIPQFFLVLKGDMSMVGPRPDPPIQRADYDQIIWIKRCKVKSGITGLAQVNGRSSGGINKRIENDIYWSENISLLLYFKILIKTPFVLFKNSN
tara:strand:+ start:23 stop:640 length:618 start_codon:yes stop_codon:yes gene_type:complete